jgi:hypothetical protein
VEAAEITPYPVYVSSDSPSMMRLDHLDTKFVGYGAENWESSGDYSHAKFGVKHIGQKTVSSVELGFFWMEGEETGALPGDSGGPIFAEIDGETKVIGLNHAMTSGTKIVPVLDRHGQPKIDRKGNPKTEEVTIYGSTIGTMLTRDNLCWVVQDSKVEIPGVDCK